MWGFITVLVDALIPRLREVFELTYFQSGLVQFAFFGAYLLLSLPGGALIGRIGYKRGILVGLGTMACGCLLFIPASALRVYGLFLLALFVLAGGITVLQVAANPYVAALGSERTSSARLNLAQGFNSLGTTLAPLVSAAFLLGDTILSAEEREALSNAALKAYYAAEASAVQLPFGMLAGVLLALMGVFMLFDLPRLIERADDLPESLGDLGSVWTRPHLVLGALGIFVYVGAEVTIGSYLVDYFVTLDIRTLTADGPLHDVASVLVRGDLASVPATGIAASFVSFYWGGAMVGRFIGAGLTQRLPPSGVLATFALAAGALVVTTTTTSGVVAVVSVLAVGLFNSIMFPTIFTLALRGLGPQAAQGSGILCMAIFGGAVIPPLYGSLADQMGIQAAFVVAVACYAYIAFYGLYGHRVGQPEATPGAPLPS